MKFTERSSVELITKPPAMRGLRNLSFLPEPNLTHSSLTETMETPEIGSGLSSESSSPRC